MREQAMSNLQLNFSFVPLEKAPKAKARSLDVIFGAIYTKNAWGNPESHSGSGSSLQNTQWVRAELPALIKELGINSMLDAPCGDFFWMKEMDLDIRSYTGCDVVDELIQNNTARYARNNRQFVKLDITKDKLPSADLIFCRDCLVHLSFEHIRPALNNFILSGSKYLITTTFPNRFRNEEIETGDWRPLNLQVYPFYFPRPIKIIHDMCVHQDGSYCDKSLGIWKLADLPNL
jgi:hypothetical protein